MRVLMMVDNSADADPPTSPGDANAPRKVAVTANRIDSRELFSGTREITICHGEGLYRLRLTSQNKLILTK